MDQSLGIADDENVQRKRGTQLRNHLVNSGSIALVKSGQALSLRPDLIRNKIWAEELGKLVDAVGAFSDMDAMKIMKKELADLAPRLEVTRREWEQQAKARRRTGKMSGVEAMVESDSVLSLFEFSNDNQAVASASIGQVYKARSEKAPLWNKLLEKEAARWGEHRRHPHKDQTRRPHSTCICFDVLWLQGARGDRKSRAFGMQLFGELDYVREANNCERFRALYGDWNDIQVPAACPALTRRRVLVMEWVEGTKGPWKGQEGIDMVRSGLRCSVDQLMTTGLFHATHTVSAYRSFHYGSTCVFLNTHLTSFIRQG
jgi:predicted unusual protein kinase regulating ubiquinone biosynthesis (AarF/ABC1/UbiB family)